MTFKLEINCDNAAFAAFEDDCLVEELQTIISDVIEEIGKGETMGYLRDSNGNRVGHFNFKGKRKE